jgi:hypothetical protein
MTTNKDALLADWRVASENLASAKHIEARLRKEVVAAFSQDQKPGHSGTETLDIGFGYKLKIVHKLSYKLDNANICEKLHAVLDKIEKSVEGGNIIAERIVKWSPELSLTEYKLLSNPHKALIDTVLTVSDATPSIELVSPK